MTANTAATSYTTPETARATATRPALLISLHDVSPLTLDDCRDAVAVLDEIGVTPAELSVLVIPCHEGRIAVDQHAPTLRFLHDLENLGATLVMHGLTHRMPGRAWTPHGFARGHVFARGQGELLRATAAETTRRLEEGIGILRRAGLAQAANGFVPPAWLLSAAARDVVRQVGFDFYETFAGIVEGDRLRARRVIGWGSLNAVEAMGTSIWARIQCGLSPVDTRLAVHPADMRRPGQRKSVRRAIAGLLPRMHAQSYTRYLGANRPALATR